MFSSIGFEKCEFLYQTEGLPHDLPIEQFGLKQGVPVNEFNKNVVNYNVFYLKGQLLGAIRQNWLLT